MTNEESFNSNNDIKNTLDMLLDITDENVIF